MYVEVRRYRRWVGRLVLGLTVAAIWVPVAQAELPGAQHTNWFGPIGGVGSPTPSVVSAVPDAPFFGPIGEVGSPTGSTVATAPYGALFGPIGEVGSPVGSIVATAPNGPLFGPIGAVNAVAQPGTTPVSAPGFDWGDVGVGIGIGAGFVLLLAAGLAVALRRRTPVGA